MKKQLILLFSTIILPISVFASDVYYCSEDAVTGFDPKQNFKRQRYNPGKFKIMIDFKNEYIDSNDIFFPKNEGKCISTYDDAGKILYCISRAGSAFSINKTNLKFIKSFIFNVKDYQDDIVIGYGSCQKF